MPLTVIILYHHFDLDFCIVWFPVITTNIRFFLFFYSYCACRWWVTTFRTQEVISIFLDCRESGCCRLTKNPHFSYPITWMFIGIYRYSQKISTLSSSFKSHESSNLGPAIKSGMYLRLIFTCLFDSTADSAYTRHHGAAVMWIYASVVI